jgi:cellobiose phosphorylase
VVDPPGEAVYLRNDDTGERWSATPAPAGRKLSYLSRFGQGYVAHEHARRHAVGVAGIRAGRGSHQDLRLRIQNLSNEARRLSATYYVDWCLADTRSRSSGHIVTTVDPLGRALCPECFSPGVGTRVAFVDGSTRLTVDPERANGRRPRPPSGGSR